MAEPKAGGLEERSLIPVQPQPEQGFLDFFDKALLRALHIGIFNPQDENSIMMAGEEPVEQRGVGPA